MASLTRIEVFFNATALDVIVVLVLVALTAYAIVKGGGNT